MIDKRTSSLGRVWSTVRQYSLTTSCFAADANVCAHCPFAHSKTILEFARSGDRASEEASDRTNLPTTSIKAGTAIITENNRPNQIFVLLRGWAYRYKTHTDGGQLVLDHVLPGDVLNLSATFFDEDNNGASASDLANDAERNHGIDALTDVDLCALSGERLRTELRKNPGLAVDLMLVKHRQNRFLEQNMYFLGAQKPSQRVASVLLQLYDRAAPAGLAANDEIHLPFTQRHLGDAMALSQVHIQRTLKQLAQLRLATWTKGLVTIHNRKRLEKFADWPSQKSWQPSKACPQCFLSSASS